MATGIVWAAETGKWLDLRADGEPDDPARQAAWSDDREITGDELAEVLSVLQDRSVVVQVMGARVTGPVDLSHREFRGALWFDRCAFTGPVDFTESALSSLSVSRCHFAAGLGASHMTVTHSVLARRTVVNGSFRLRGSRIGGELSLRGARLSYPDGWALYAESCEVASSAWLCDGLVVDGDVSLRTARIGGRFGLDAEISGIVDAQDLTVRVLDDDPDAWPAGSALTGMSYERIGQRGDARTRLSWLARIVTSYEPQPYRALAHAYEASGHDTAARRVLIAKQRVRRASRRNRVHNLVSRPWSAILRTTIGYGFAPWRAIPWVAGILAAAWLIFATAPASAFTTSQPTGEPFRPFLHAVEALIPLVKVGGTEWIAHGGYVWWHTGFSALGWFFATVVAAGLAGVFKRD
ncbi:pentapeptide repeat-containing protein [Phytomonospora endophytica]|uniref:pentapeptide repeat-containing protein n=1 Tax=Phytomonospora endophytica TaxID=714109 RepID=UPI001616324D|nr:pentapeptide repeat-containing protein [Phytomonospora endophytica]GIG69796.1 oxidoreductase [Phytomonospora endophytica]